MPLRLNVGLNRKLGETNYGSRGASVNVEMELDSTLIGEPTKLQERIRQAFAIVRTSLAEELNGHAAAKTNGTNGHTNGTSDDMASRPAGNVRTATQSQVRALHAIAKNKGVVLGRLLQGRYQVDRPEDLTIKQASELIDTLKSPSSGEPA
jgi:hypothetical protein